MRLTQRGLTVSRYPPAVPPRFVSTTEAGFGFLSIFLEVLFRRCFTVYQFNFYKNKVLTQTCFLKNMLLNVVIVKLLRTPRMMLGGQWVVQSHPQHHPAGPNLILAERTRGQGIGLVAPEPIAAVF